VRRRAPLVAVLTASGLSAAGSAMTLFAIPWFVLDTTGSGARTGLIAALETLGLLLSVALAGPLVDRYGARLLSMFSDIWTIVAVAAIPLAYPLWRELDRPVEAAEGATRKWAAEFRRAHQR
jgi:MFS family permease